MTAATLIHQSPAYELSVAIDTGRYGHHLKFVSFVPVARRPQPQVRLQANLSTRELRALHRAIGVALDAAGGVSAAAGAHGGGRP
jgi:hypothetical protein